MASLSSLVAAKIAELTEFNEVLVVANANVLLTQSVMPPGCYVYRERNSAEANGMQAIVSQMRTEQIGLIVVTHNVSDAKGGASAEDNEVLCDLIESKLLGFIADENYTMMEYVSGAGAAVQLKNGFHYWRELYRASRIIRSI
jgi:hypothetical protein